MDKDRNINQKDLLESIKQEIVNVHPIRNWLIKSFLI